MSAPIDALTTGFALQPLDETRFGADVVDEWRLFAGPNGGWGLGIAAAVAETLDDRPIRVIHLGYLRAPATGPTEVRHTDVRAGRSVRTIGVNIGPDGSPDIAGQVTVAADRPGPSYSDIVMPEAPPPDEIAPSERTEGPGVPPFTALWDYRHTLGNQPPRPGAPNDFDPSPDAIGDRAGEGLIGGWIRPASGILVDPIRLAAMCDSWYPPYFPRVGGDPLSAGVPSTIHLTVHLFPDAELDGAVSPDDWWLVRSTTSTMTGGYCDLDTEVWHQSGRLVARAHQLLALLRLA